MDTARQTAPEGGPTGGLVFLSYSHVDKDWLQRLLVLLAPVVRNRRLEPWADDYIAVGDQWRRDIDRAVARARVAVLLVSADFLASSFIMDQEIPALLRHGVRLVPVLVHDCLWDQVPVLTEVQWAHDPGRDGPLDLGAHVPGVRDRKLTALCRRILELLPSDTAASPTPDWAVPVVDSPAVLKPATGGRRGALHAVPALPPGYVTRDDVTTIRDALLSADGVALGLAGDLPGVGLSGQGGIGKSVLAAAVAHEPAIAQHFPDGVFWVSLGEDADILAAQLDLLSRLGVDTADRSSTAAARALRQACAERACLVIVDDVWSLAAARSFAVGSRHSRVLYTARDAALLAAAGAQVQPVAALPDAAARALLANASGTGVQPLPAAATEVLDETGRVALAVALVGAAVKGGTSWEEVLTQLRRGRHIYGDHPYARTFKALSTAVAALDQRLAAAYLSLAVFPADAVVPLAAVQRFWHRMYSTSEAGARADVELLASRGLLTLEGQAISFHDLQHDYLLLQADDLEVLHADLLAAYRALLPPGGAWWQLPLDEPYVWQHLIEHLHRSGDSSGVVTTVTDVRYLISRCFLDGPHAAEADLRLASRIADDPELAWWQRWLALYGHLLKSLPTVEDTAATAAIRLRDRASASAHDRLQDMVPSTCLVARWGLSESTPAARRVLSGHTGPVEAVAFSPDGQLLATASWDGAARLWNADTGAELHTFTGHTDIVTAVTFSPDGLLLATASWDGTARLWDADTGAEQHTLTGHTDIVTAVTFSPDGLLLATASGDGTVRLWDPATGTQHHTLPGHTGTVYAVAFSPDRQLLATASDDGTARLWNTDTGAQWHILTGHTDAVRWVAFSPDGRLLATASDDGTARLWNTDTGAGRHTLVGHTGIVEIVAFSPDGQLLATASDDDTARLWNTHTGAELHALNGHTDTVEAVAFSPDRTLLATASDDGTVRLWNPDTGAQWHILTGHTGPVTAVAFSPDRTLLATASDDGTARLWNPDTGAQRHTLAGHTDTVEMVAFSPDGQVLATASDDGTARLWNTDTGAELHALTGHTDMVQAVTFSPERRLLATVSWDGTAQLWDPDTGTELHTFAGHTDMVQAVAFSPDGQLLATASWDRTARLWNPDTGAEQHTLTGHTGTVRLVVFSPDGELLATASDDGTARLWNTNTGAELLALTGHTDMVTVVAFSPDGQLLATASWDRTARLWNPETGAEQHTLTGHTDIVTAVAFGPDGQLLATASRDGTARLWNPDTGAEQHTLTGHTGPVTAVAFSPDGKLLATTSEDGTVRLWDPATGALLHTLRLGVTPSTPCWHGRDLAVGVHRELLLLTVRTTNST